MPEYSVVLARSARRKLEQLAARMARRIISRTAPVPPFVVFGLLMLVVVMLFPPLVTWLPALLFGK